MKRLTAMLTCFNLILCTFILPLKYNKSVCAEGMYARILNEQTIFYGDPYCTLPKFVLPYSYFVKIVSIGDDSTRVMYMDNSAVAPSREGYIKNCDLYVYAGTPDNLYPDFTITVSVDDILFSDFSKQNPKSVLSVGQKAIFYGTYNSQGENFCYVYASGFVGYVRTSSFSPFTLPLSPIALPDFSQQTSEPDTEGNSVSYESPKNEGSLLQTVIIIAVSLVAVCTVYALLKPQFYKNHAAATDGDRDDF